MNDDFYSWFQTLLDSYRYGMVNDTRPEAVKALESVWPQVTSAESILDDIEYVAWNEFWDCEPGWVFGEAAIDDLENDHEYAWSCSNARNAWVSLTNK
jgi:hypothetical protein